MDQKKFLHNIRKQREVLYDYVDRCSPNLVESNIHPSKYQYSKNVMTGLHNLNDLNTAFFASQNVNLLQRQIKHFVYESSGGKFLIDRQSDSELVIIMRSIYLQNARNLPNNIKEQVEHLNELVVKYAGPIIFSNVKQYYGYISDINRLPTPLEQPKNMSSAGTRTLEGSANNFFTLN
jgi:hypothetical protein